MTSTEHLQPQSTQDLLRKKDRLPHGLVMNLLSAFGNHEAKALTLLSLTKNAILERKNLFRQILDSQGSDVGWRPERNTPFHYCEQSLEPIGLVAKEELDAGGAWGYKLTDLGAELGIPLAGLLLDFSHRHQLPLHHLLGPTNSASDRRAPQTRYEVFYYLLASTLPTRLADLKNYLQIEVHGPHFKELMAHDLIEYDSVDDANKPIISYRLHNSGQGDSVPPYIDKKGKSYTKLTEDVASIFGKQPERQLTLEDVVDELNKNGRHYTYIRDAKQIVGAIARHLTTFGLLERSRFGPELKSVITLSDAQRAVLEDFISIIEGFENQDPDVLARGHRLAQEIQTIPQLFSDLMRRAYEASPMAGRERGNRLGAEILNFIQSNSRCTNKQIREHLSTIGLEYSMESIALATSKLLVSRLIEREKEGKVSHFHVVESTAQSDSL